MKKSNLAFILALISISFFAIGLIISYMNSGILDATDHGGLFIFISSLIALIGSVFSLIGIKEAISYKKIIGMSINFLITSIFLLMVVANIIDIYKSFS